MLVRTLDNDIDSSIPENASNTKIITPEFINEEVKQNLYEELYGFNDRSKHH